MSMSSYAMPWIDYIQVSLELFVYNSSILASNFFIHLESVDAANVQFSLSVDDIVDHPELRMGVEDLDNATISQMRSWLLFRGDSLKNTSSATECKVK